MKTRVVVAMIFLLGLGASGYYTHKASAATPTSASLQCCSGDPDGPLWPTPPTTPTTRK